MNQDLLFEKAQKQFLEKLPFVVYKKPESELIVGVFQENNELHLVEDYTEKGYVFASFDGNNMVLIPESISAIMKANFVVSAINFTQESNAGENSETKMKHITLVEKAIAAITTGSFSKLVISRNELIDVPNFDCIETYKRLLNLYKEAFSYCFFHPEIGLWMGAFSEQLLKVKDNMLFTMSVAGTQKWDKNKTIIWGEKEKKEQKIVTDYIVKRLSSIVNNIQVTNPYTLKAGILAHIKTDVSGTFSEEANLESIIQLLHPTPAVCGLPKEAAKRFILDNENYDREFYSGFHGELNTNFATGENATDLYVNLRCMKIDTAFATATLFVGGGITIDSDPEKEWTETVNKSQTMKKVIN
ncbi:MAG: chorismate-binding protein [Flavobacterium sp.]|nr:chorismate-binding protein [Flavobacterium sp.]